MTLRLRSVRDARPSDWFIAGMFFMLGAIAAAAVVGIIVVLVGLIVVVIQRAA